MGSPLAAISGAPFGMVIEDVKALQGKKGKIWSGAPVLAALDIPLAFVLDTAFLPISCLTWLFWGEPSSDSERTRTTRAERRERKREIERAQRAAEAADDEDLGDDAEAGDDEDEGTSR